MSQTAALHSLPIFWPALLFPFLFLFLSFFLHFLPKRSQSRLGCVFLTFGQRYRHSVVTLELSPIFHVVENGDKKIEKGEKLVSTSLSEPEVTTQNERVGKLLFVLEISNKISKGARKFKGKIALISKSSNTIWEKDRVNEWEEDKTHLLKGSLVKDSRTGKVVVPRPAQEQRKKRPFLGQYQKSRDDADKEKKTEVRNINSLPPTQQRKKKSAKRVSLAPGTWKHEVVVFKKRRRILKARMGRRLPIIIVAFEDGARSPTVARPRV